ncbi:putative urease accessory protein UreD [Citreicella sp. SE45]|nr:putative urease accessory protein UreD [Citreicella sp. SE45]
MAAGAVLALFAQPFVRLPGAALRQELALTLHPNATVVLCDGICLRDPADAGLSWQSVLTAEREDGSKLFRDAQSVDGPALARLSELHGDARAFASVSVLAPEPVLGFLETALRPALAALEGYAACAPLRGGAGLAMRIACPDGGALTRAMAAVQTALDRRLFP